MAHFEEVEVVAMMPEARSYAHALGADGSVYTYMPRSDFSGKVWQRVGSGESCWGRRMCLKPYRQVYEGKFIIKALAE